MFVNTTISMSMIAHRMIPALNERFLRKILNDIMDDWLQLHLAS